ncbi:MAG: hypothetical protein GF364_10490 [Candidatus Lokiarchaeota archaeon]|nr:hypothetical protein [Candidatus Lokiarchaeota archaeon]
MTKKKALITGNIVPTLTYFNKKGHINGQACRLQAMHALNNGADALFVLGSTGEGTYLKELGDEYTIERIKLILVTYDAILDYSKNSDKSIGLIIGAYGEDAQSVVEDMNKILATIVSFIKDDFYTYPHITHKLWDIYLNPSNAKISTDSTIMRSIKTMIDGFVVPPPLKKTMNEDELLDFYLKILKKSEYPVYLYNNPKSFADNVISENVLKKLVKNEELTNLYGIKDSSVTIEQKKEYLQFLNEGFSVSCGKEGMIGLFLKQVPVGKRKLAGLVPSLGNMTSNPKIIYKLGLEGKDDQMMAAQDEMNSFRNLIYDATQSKGKAQRGVKFCFRYLYEDKIPEIPINVRTEFQREVSYDIHEQMIQTINNCIKKEYIKKVE